MQRKALRVVIASVAVTVAGCGRLVESTRPTPMPIGTVRQADTPAARETLPAAAAVWRCVALAAHREGCPSRPQAEARSADATNTPSAPFNLAGTAAADRVALTWAQSPAGDAPTSYVLEAGSAPGRADLANYDTGTVTTTFTVDGVPPGTYYLRVRARNALGSSAPSNELTLTVGGSGCTAPPGSPASLAAAIQGSTVTLNWTAPLDGCATSYIVQAGSAPGLSNVTNLDTASAATSFTMRGVESGQFYMRVRGANAFGRGGPSNEVAVTVMALPLAETTFIAFGDSITSGESGLLDGQLNANRLAAQSRFYASVLLPPDQRYPAVLQQQLAARYRPQMPSVRNQGRNGEAVTDPDTFSRFFKLLSTRLYRSVLIMEGTNDLYDHDSSRIPGAIAGLRQMLHEAKRRGVTPYLATIPPMNPRGFRGSVYAWDFVTVLNDGIRALAASEGVTLVDVYQGFNNNLGLLGVDGLHPNADGYAKIADVFYAAIKATLETTPPQPIVMLGPFSQRIR